MTLRRSLLWVVVASVVPVLVLSAVLIEELDRRQRQGTREHVLRTIRVLTDAVDRELHVTLATLNGLADSPLLNDTQLPAFHAQLIAVAQGDAAPDRVPGGLGLGLTLVDRLVALHGGTVTADSPGHGLRATFTVRLPAIDEPYAWPTRRRPFPPGGPAASGA